MNILVCIKQIYKTLLIVAFLTVGMCNASKQGHEGLNIKPTQPSERLVAPPQVSRPSLPGSGSVGVQRQGGRNSIQGHVATNSGSFFAGGWKSGSNQGMFGGMNRQWKEEVRNIIFQELGLLN